MADDDTPQKQTVCLVTGMAIFGRPQLRLQHNAAASDFMELSACYGAAHV